MRYEKKRRDEKGNRQVPTVWQAAAVTGHVLQNRLVAALLECGALGVENFRNVADPATGACRPVYEWHAFPGLTARDFDVLERAWIPTARSEYGDWVGFTSFGRPYDESVHPELVYALYGIRTDRDGMREARMR